MYPYITIFDKFRLPTYGLAFVFAVTIALIIARKLMPQMKDDILFSSIYSLIGVGIGSKLFYILSKVPRIIIHHNEFKRLFEIDKLTALNYLAGGIMFYGGLFGSLLGIYVYCRRYSIDYSKLIKVYIPLIPFVHAFGRIGCFLGGCCYGIEYNGMFAVRYPYNELMPELSSCPRFPVQLLESSLDFVLFIALLLLLLKKAKSGVLVSTYLISYSIIRFFDEFLRGDLDRGKYKYFSTSQLISVVVFGIGIFYLVRSLKVNKQVVSAQRAE